MGSKATFTEAEWADLQWALMLAGSHIAASDYPGWWKSMKEAAAGSHFLAMMQSSDSELVRDLTTDQARTRPPDVADRTALAGDPAINRIRAAADLVRTKAPEDLEHFTHLLLSVAQVMAEESDGVSDKESKALARVQEALGSGTTDS